MRFLICIFALSAFGAAAATFTPELSEWILLAGPCAIVSALLLLRKWQRRLKTPRNWAVVDGSNVLHWKDGVPNISTVREVVDRLKAKGLTPGVVFDANIGYKISDRYMNDKTLAALLGLPASHVMVAPKGTPADPLVLEVARDHGAAIVTNDRFRDWVDDYSDVLEQNARVQGGYQNDALWLSL